MTFYDTFSGSGVQAFMPSRYVGAKAPHGLFEKNRLLESDVGSVVAEVYVRAVQTVQLVRLALAVEQCRDRQNEDRGCVGLQCKQRRLER